MVQITFEAEVKDFLLSDFDNWNLILNNCYIAENEQDWDDSYAKHSEYNRKEIVASWDSVFDLNRYTPNWDVEPDKRTIQATLWEVRISQVQKVEHFLAK